MIAILYAILAFVCGSSLLLWFQRVRVDYQREGTLLSPRAQSVSPLGMVDVGVTFLIWLVMQSLGLLLVGRMMGLCSADLQDIASLDAGQQLELSGGVMLSQLVGTVLAIFWFRYRHGTVDWFGARRRVGRDLLVGGAASLMLLPVVMLIQLLLTQLVDYTHPTLDSLRDNFNFRTAMWAWVAAVGVAPVTEEFFFRGVLQGFLQRAYGCTEIKGKLLVGGELQLAETNTSAFVLSPRLKLVQNWAPIVMTSLIFAGVHLGQGPAPIPLFFLSLGLGYLFRQTGSLLPCIIVHLVLNTFSMSLLTVNLVFPEWFPAPVEATPGCFFLR